MNAKALDLIKNFSYTFISNLITMILSIMMVLILPKVLGVEEYGYFQLFIFYASYVGFLHFGWNDGIYLRYGGLYYKELNHKLFNNQFIMLVLFQLLISTIIITTSSLFIDDAKRLYIFYMISLSLIIVNARYMLIFILQATNRIKEFSVVILLEKIIFIILVICFIALGMINFRLFILSDVIGKFMSLVIAIFFCKEIVLHKLKNFHFNLKEMIQNISVGIKLMFANIAGMLIIGVVRFGIERSWNVATFGKVSLTLSISNFLMIFVNAIGIVLFPILRRVDINKLSEVYNIIRHLLGATLLGVLVFYYPIKVGLMNWLPSYEESVIYMALVFPMVVYEGKTALLLNTYLKALRKEKLMLSVNISTFLLSILFTLITTVVLNNLELAIMSILILLAFKSIIAEILLAKHLQLTVIKDITLEVAMTISFLIVSWFISTWTAFTIYFLIYIFYLIIKRKELFTSIVQIKELIKR